MSQPDTIYIDVREPHEYAAGHLQGAINLPHSRLTENTIPDTLPKDAKLILYCRTGNRSGLAAKLLRRQGYDAVNGINQATIEATRKI